MNAPTRGPVVTRRALLGAAAVLLGRPARAQNLVTADGIEMTAPPVRLTEADVVELLARRPAAGDGGSDEEARRVARKLGEHVQEFVVGFPWQPFHVTIGISGYETSFNHPDRLFYALAAAFPYLPAASRASAARLLGGELDHRPPYAVEGYENCGGRPREAYDVPEDLRVGGRDRATSALGVYSLWAWCDASGSREAARKHWDAARGRIEPLLSGDYAFHPARQSYTGDEAQTLNGDLAGLIGAVRLARLLKDGPTEKRSLAAAARLLELRVNLERVNPRVLERTRSTTKNLHASKLARYCDLVPEVGEALRARTDGCAAARLKAVRETRNAWFMAFGERLIGGENYISPPHFSHALCSGATWVEEVPPDQLLAWVDVPWCRGDLYFIEKCAQALWAAAGRRRKAA